MNTGYVKDALGQWKANSGENGENTPRVCTHLRTAHTCRVCMCVCVCKVLDSTMTLNKQANPRINNTDAPIHFSK